VLIRDMRMISGDRMELDWSAYLDLIF